MPSCLLCSEYCTSRHSFCMDCVEKSPRSLWIRARLCEIEEDQRRLEGGGVLNLLDPAAREILAVAASPDEPHVYMGHLARRSGATEEVCKRVLAAAGVSQMASMARGRSVNGRTRASGKKKSATYVLTNDAWRAIVKVAERLELKKEEAVASKKRAYRSITREEFVEYLNRPQVNKTDFARRLDLTPTTVHSWRRGETVPTDEAQAKIRRLIDGETLAEVFSEPKPKAPKPVVRLRQKPGEEKDPAPKRAPEKRKKRGKKLASRRLQVGRKFGSWTVIGEPEAGQVKCRCSCGSEHEIQFSALSSGMSTRCVGCRVEASKWSPPTTVGEALAASRSTLRLALSLGLRSVSERLTRAADRASSR